MQATIVHYSTMSYTVKEAVATPGRKSTLLRKMKKPGLIEFIERRYGRKPPPEEVCRTDRPPMNALPDGFSVAIIGAGIAGPAFARRLLSSAVELGVRIKVTLISRPSCNYCGGLVTNLSLQTLRERYMYEPAPEVVLNEIDEVVLVNDGGSVGVSFDAPLVSVFRTSRFGPMGLDEDFRQSILDGLPERAREMLIVEQPAVATAVELPTKARRGVVTFVSAQETKTVQADLIVLASGFRSLQSKLLSSFREATGYRPPRLMSACVTEVDLSGSGGHALDRRILILNGIVKGAVIALIPKHENWITIPALNKVLTFEDIRSVFAHPIVREYVQVDDAESKLACGKICASDVFIGPARRFYGDGWVVLGDLSGYGRVLKDGYFAALLGAQLAADTVVHHGCSREDFARYYHARLKQFRRDNRMGVPLFALNILLARSGVFNRVIIEAMSGEKATGDYGGFAHAAFRALSTGELSYSCIGLLFTAGLISWALGLPFRALAALRRGGRR